MAHTYTHTLINMYTLNKKIWLLIATRDTKLSSIVFFFYFVIFSDLPKFGNHIYMYICNT